MSTFTDALLAAEPAIPGLDATVVVPARRMHFTLGVMSLDREGSRRSTGPANGANADSSASESDTQPKRNVEAAIKVLQDVKPKVMELLAGEKLRVSLDSMDIMQPERRNQERAHVMWVGPALDSASTDLFKKVARECLGLLLRLVHSLRRHF